MIAGLGDCHLERDRLADIDPVIVDVVEKGVDPVRQLADRGSVRIFSSGSALDGGPSLYLQTPEDYGHGARFREIASFEPFGGAGGTRVATTSTTTGANLLVSGVAPGGAEASVIKYDFARPNAQSTTLEAVRLGQVWSGKGSPPALGGD